MDINVQVTRVTHEELVNLLSDATYGNDALDLSYSLEDYNNLVPEDKREGDCWEDHLADVLLNGGSIQVQDIYAQGEAYGDLPHQPDEDDPDIITYTLTLKDILEGLSNEITFKLMQDVISAEGDMYTAYAIIQRIVFGQEIYG